MKIYIYIILAISIVHTSFLNKGVLTVGGSIGYFKDFNASASVLHVSPSFGYLLNDFIMLELGYSHVNINNDKYNPYSYQGLYIHGDQTTHSYGMRFFVNKLYIGFEYVQGLEISMATTINNDFIYGLDKFNGNEERGLVKVGFLHPIAQNLYLDTSYHYLFILDEDIREQDIELAEVGYLTLGVSYFWNPKK